MKSFFQWESILQLVNEIAVGEDRTLVRYVWKYIIDFKGEYISTHQFKLEIKLICSFLLCCCCLVFYEPLFSGTKNVIPHITLR